MQFVEQHVIDKSNPRYARIDAAAFKSKTCTMLATTRYVNPTFIKGSTSTITKCRSVYSRMKHTKLYRQR